MSLPFWSLLPQEIDPPGGPEEGWGKTVGPGSEASSGLQNWDAEQPPAQWIILAPRRLPHSKERTAMWVGDDPGARTAYTQCSSDACEMIYACDT